MKTRTVRLAQFDAAKFKARYGLQDTDVRIVPFNGEAWLYFDDAFDIPEKPVYDPPDPPPELKSKEDYASELIELLAEHLPPAKKVQVFDKLLRFTGARPLEKKVP